MHGEQQQFLGQGQLHAGDTTSGGVQTELAPVAACCRRGAGTEQGGGSASPRRRRPALDLAEIPPPWRRTGGNTGTAPGVYLTWHGRQRCPDGSVDPRDGRFLPCELPLTVRGGW